MSARVPSLTYGVLVVTLSTLLSVDVTRALAGEPPSSAPRPGARVQSESRLAGGATTIHRFDTSAFSLPAANLSMTRRLSFFAGNSFFTQPWVQAPASTSGRDGLGPLFNTNACQSCHLKDGRGRPPEPGEPMISMVIRLSVLDVPGDDPALERTGAMPDPSYGDQIQNRALVGVAKEADPVIRWHTIRGAFPDGTAYELIEPRIELENLAYGPLAPSAVLSARVAPALVGMGLLEAIPESALLEREDPDDRDRDGISGRANRVWDVVQRQRALGRFGWKAGQPNVRQQVAAAFAGDLGITSRLYPAESCSERQVACRAAAGDGSPELEDSVLDLVTLYVELLGVPARRTPRSAAVRAGEALFRSIGCTGCHVESWTTGSDPQFPELAKQRIHPYTDLLLHDMGEGLADGRPEFVASGREWRTPPLWGIGLIEVVSRHTRFLHDGRARSLEEAILWHGGEAQPARDAFVRLSSNERDQLLYFLKSL